MQALQVALEKLEAARDLHALEEVRLLVLGKKGLLAHAFAGLKDLTQEEKTSYAQELNQFKDKFSALHAQKKQTLQALELQERLQAEKLDPTLAHTHFSASLGHPLNYTKERIIAHFTQRGFKLHLGTLIEDDFHNFSALNIPPPPRPCYARHLLL
ncbi:hypothetical protein NHP190003_03280 [Helicobacter sp. NHP19-003]|uniref:Phenylalanine--tRNA ligase n=1 Tax=Helicobacter gastrocanis TaxID=2849641 RepID=A0ABM7SAL8_9HELI|nr:hypothetical protein NHP190003_03280 [Helicobacter sp. NHP19-003]